MKFNSQLLTDGAKFVPSFRFNKGYTRLNYLHLDLTSNCNLRCKMCEWRYKVEKRTMPPAIFKKAIDEGMQLGLKKVVIAATGESLTHHNFSELINYAHEKGLKIELVTNLTLMSDKILQALLLVDKLVVSLDSPIKETYEKIRVGAIFESTLKNLKRVVEVKKKTEIQINYVIQRDNFSQMEEMLELIHSLGGIDSISFKFVHNDVNPERDGVQLSEEDMKELIKKFPAIAQKLKEFKLKCNFTADALAKDAASQIFAGTLKPWIHDFPCYNLWFGAYISPMGLVFACCNFYEEKHALGDLRKQSLIEIWNSNRYNEVRNKFKGRKPKICEACPSDNREFHNQLLKIPLSKVLLGL